MAYISTEPSTLYLPFQFGGPVLRICLMLTVAWIASLQAQLKYLKNDPTKAIGVHVGLVDYDGTQTRAFAGSFVPMDFLEIGVSYGDVRARFDSESDKERIGFLSPYVELVADPSDKQPFAVALRLSYLTYLKKRFDNKIVAATFSITRDFPLAGRFTFYPEIGLSKSIGTESDDIKPLFFIAGGITSTVGLQFQFSLVPRLGLQNGSTYVAVALELALLP